MTASLYAHIPFCKKKCDYCDFFSIEEKYRLGKCNDLSDSYLSALVKEAAFYAESYGIEAWDTVYLGGGTPSLLSPRQISFFFSELKKILPFKENAEVTMEVNPDDVSDEFLVACTNVGVNRLSMGIQAVDDRALNAVNRGSSEKIIASALNCLKKKWHGRLSVDFIAGLPCHTYDSFKRQFGILDEYPGIDHVSLYTLMVEENTPLWKKIEDNEINYSFDKADRMWLLGRNILEKHGFVHYEVSSFAKKGFESRHNCAYWTQKSYVGIGAGATGTIYDFEEKKALRWTNGLSIPAYISGVEKCLAEDKNPALLRRQIEELSAETLEFEALMLGFRRLEGISSLDFQKKFGKSLEERIGSDRDEGLFFQWRKKGLALVRKSPDGDKIYAMSRRGILLLNRFLEELM